MKELFKI